MEYDSRLQPLTEINAESFGFPSLESYMSVVIMGHLFFSLKSILLLPLGLLVVFVVGFTRVYSCSRFPHQVVGSWLLGFFGLLVCMHIVDNYIKFHKMTHDEHTAWMLFIMLGIASNIAFNMENNDSRILNVPKKEFIRVMGDILSSGAKNNDQAKTLMSEMNEENDLTKDIGSRGINPSPRTMLLKEAQRRQVVDGLMKRKKYVKNDSLYHLQKSIEEREKKLKNVALQSTSSTNYKKSDKLYGDEDFFSSTDNDTVYSNHSI